MRSVLLHNLKNISTEQKLTLRLFTKYHWSGRNLNEGSVTTVNFTASLYSDCQLADALYHYTHICITVINIWIYFKLQIFFFSYIETVNYLTLHYTTVVTAVILTVNVLNITYMFTNRYMMFSISSRCTRTVLRPLEYNNKSNHIVSNNTKWGVSTLHNMRCHCPHLTIFTQNVFKFVCEIIKQHPSP